MGRRWSDGGYSSEIRLSRLFGDEHIPLAQISRTGFLLRSAREIPAQTDATILIVVDGREKRRHAFIHRGADGSGCFVEYF
jgi:hypothetical protein